MNKSHTTILRQQFTVFPGIEYIREIFEDQQDGRQCAYILRICHGADVRLDTVMNPDGQFALQTPSASAKACRKENETLLGVINADFFNMTNGTPWGVVVMDGAIIKEEMPDNTHFFGMYRDGSFVIGDEKTFVESKRALKMAVGGRDILLDGEEIPAPVIMPKPERHPRTGVGICENGDLLLVVLEGRNPGVAEGMQLERFGAYFKSLGARKALNLDGGGSSLMALRMLGQQEIAAVNTPSDGFERVCANGIAVYAQHKGDGLCHSAHITPQQEYVAPGTHLHLSAYGLDNLLGVCDLPENAVFSVPEDSGCTVSPEGVFHAAKRDCDVTVSVSVGEKLLGTAALHVRTPDALQTPVSSIYTEGEIHDLGVSATLRGRSVLTNSTSYHCHALGDIGWFDEKGLFHARNEACEGDVLVCVPNNGPSTTMHVRVGRLPQQLDIAPEDIKTTGCTVCTVQPLDFSPRCGRQVYQVEKWQAEAQLQFVTPVHKQPRAMGMWVHSLAGEMPDFALTVYDGVKALQTTDFIRGEPSDPVWTYTEALVPDNTAQSRSLNMIISMRGEQSEKLALDNFRLVYDYVNDDMQLPEIRRVSIKKYAKSGENERIKITAYFGMGDMLPCYAPLDYKRLRILIDDTEYTGMPGHYGVNKGAASLLLHNVFVSKGVHRVRVCAQACGGKQVWEDITFDTEQLEEI